MSKLHFPLMSSWAAAPALQAWPVVTMDAPSEGNWVGAGAAPADDSSSEPILSTTTNWEHCLPHPSALQRSSNTAQQERLNTAMSSQVVEEPRQHLLSFPLKCKILPALDALKEPKILQAKARWGPSSNC